MSGQNNTLDFLRQTRPLGFRSRMALVVRLSIPAILAEISSILMQYIDAAMVGSLGERATAAIGLIASTTWLFSGLCISFATGFSVQIAHLMGAGRPQRARSVLRQGYLCALVFGALLALAGVALSFVLPQWLGGEADVRPWASDYFLIYACALPAVLLRQLSGGALQCSGDMRTPSLLNGLMCLWDICFNFLLIFPTCSLRLGSLTVPIPGAGLGVAGAALGTALAEGVTALLMVWAVCRRSPQLRLKLGGSWRLERNTLATAARIAVPLGLEHSVLCGAQIATTRIVSPLGTVAIAANSLAVTAESLCYMPGYGIAAAATTLVGQSLGAGRRDLAKSFARLTVLLGMVLMGCTGVLMFLLAPQMFALLTPVEEVRTLGVHVLRIEAFAEPLFAASIVAAGALRGAGDAVAPSVLNLVSMWGVRITASILLAPRLGLTGVWIAMCGELCFRGILFLVRLFRGKWLDRSLIRPEPKEMKST